jgi:hypothetical protein
LPTEGTMTREELDARNLGNRQLAGSSVEVVSDASEERNQEVQVRSLPYSMETPEQFRERVSNEKE